MSKLFNKGLLIFVTINACQNLSCFLPTCLITLRRERRDSANRKAYAIQNIFILRKLEFPANVLQILNIQVAQSVFIVL